MDSPAIRYATHSTNRWEQQVNNSVLRGDGFYVSYATGPSKLMVTYVSPETALVRGTGEDRQSYVLGADLRRDYEAVITDGWEACFDVYQHNRRLFCGWSTDDGYTYPEREDEDGGHSLPIRRAAHGPDPKKPALLTRDEAILLLGHGITVWVEGGGGCVEGQLAEIVHCRVTSVDGSRHGSRTWHEWMIAWNRGAHRRTVQAFTPEAALRTAERAVESLGSGRRARRTRT